MRDFLDGFLFLLIIFCVILVPHTHTHTHLGWWNVHIHGNWLCFCCTILRGRLWEGFSWVFFREYYVTGTSVSVLCVFIFYSEKERERGRAIAVAVLGTMWNLNAHDIDWLTGTVYIAIYPMILFWSETEQTSSAAACCKALIYISFTSTHSRFEVLPFVE